MLVLTRKPDERIEIGDAVEVVVLSIRGNRVRLGITAPRRTEICRGAPAPACEYESREAELAGCQGFAPDFSI